MLSFVQASLYIAMQINDEEMHTCLHICLLCKSLSYSSDTFNCKNKYRIIYKFPNKYCFTSIF